MGDPVVELGIQLLFFLVPLIVCGLIIGRTVERRHFARLDEMDAANSDFVVTNLKDFPMAVSGGPDPTMVVSEVVIGSDYLKSYLASWRGFFGGEVKSLRTLQTRAKREAIARLIEQARQQGFNALCNLRLSGIDVGGAAKSKKGMPMATVIASATAYVVAPVRGTGTGNDRPQL